MSEILSFVIALALILVIDLIWLGKISKNLYKKEIGRFYKKRFNILSSILLYSFMALGIVFFVLNNSLSTNLFSTFLVGSLFGLIVYGVYDLTNFSIIKN